jgi:hypothetical protein
MATVTGTPPVGPPVTDADPSHYFGNVLSCDLSVSKTCAVVEPTPTTGTGTCQKPIDTLVMEYAAAQAGGKQIASVEWYKGLVGSALLGTLGPVADGETISLSGFGGSPNDVQARITFTDGTTATSQFHISCSDSEMNGPEDCGKLTGDGKSNSLPAGNIWLFRGTNGSNGGITCPVNTTPTFPTETANCDFVATPDAANCSALKPVKELTMVWDGPNGVNFQTNFGQSITGVNKGDVVRFNTTGSGNDFPVNITGAVTGQPVFHISCSDSEMNGPEDCNKRQGNNKDNSTSLINDFLFAGMEGSNGAFGCPGYPAATAGRDVNYGISVRNPNASPLTVRILDAALGLDQTETIAANGTYQEIVGPRFIVPDGSNVFVNTVSVTGTTAEGASCAATDSVSVTRQQPLVPVACSAIKPVTAVSVIWDGTQTVDLVMETGETFTGVQRGNQITFLVGGAGNDVEMDIYDSATGAFIGHSVFHVSCSDSEMDGTADCGKLQGNNKANDPSLINRWLFDGMNGQLGSFACGLANTGVVQPDDSGGPSTTVTGAKVADLSDPKKFLWSLTNTGTQDVFLTNLYVAWPDGTNGQGQLRRVKLGTPEIAKDVKDATSPTVLPEDKAFEPDANRRKLKKGETKVLEIEFTVGTVFRSQDDFLVVATFSNGDEVTFKPTPVSVTGATTLDLSDNRRVRWNLTNNTPGTAQITAIRVSWPAAHTRLNRVRLAGKDVATSVNDTSSPTWLPEEKAFATNLGDRSIGPGVTRQLEVEFDKSVSGRTEGQFSIEVQFSNGDVVKFN